MKRQILIILAAVGLAAGLLLSTSAPASASPSCTKRGLEGSSSGNILAVPVSSTGDSFCHLQQGYASAGVRTLQDSIRWCYRSRGEAVLNITVDGNYGAKTKAAVKRVQQLAGITADGVYGPGTRDAMLHRQDAWEGDQDPNVCRRL